MRQDYIEALLNLYYEENYSEYDETIEWYVNPAPNKWKFYIPDLGIIVTLTCNNQGEVIEKRRMF